MPREAHTLAGFLAWALSDEVPEKLPVAFIAGEVFIEMSFEEIRTHALVKTGVAGGLFRVNEEIDLGHLFINGVRIANESAQVSNNPDIVLVSYRSLATGKVRYIERNDRILVIEGTPDQVVEIVSKGSVVKDTQLLRQAYHAAGIDEYWLIDARGEAIDFQVLHWRKSGYVAAPAKDGWRLSRVWQRRMRLTRRKDRAGEWKYTLEVRAA